MMLRKSFLFLLLGTLLLVNAIERDDFKEQDEIEEYENEMLEDDQEKDTEKKVPRLFGRRSFRSGARTSSGTRTGFRFTGRRTSGGTSGGSTGGTRRIFRRSSGGTSGGSSSGSRIFRIRRSSSGGSTVRRTSGGSSGGSSTWDKIGTVVDIAQLGTDLATVTLEQMSQAERKIVVSIGNLEGVDWQGGTLYMKEGSAIKVLPLQIATEEGIQLGATKKSGPSATGVSGAFCYTFDFIKKSFCLMFKVPYSGDNYWNFKIYDGTKQADDGTYNDLQSGAMKAGNPIQRKVMFEDSNYKIYLKDCSMTTSEQAVLQVYAGVDG